MVLSKRERMLAIVSVLVLGALAVNEFVVTPLTKRREAAANQRVELEAQLVEAQTLLDQRRLLERRWRPLLSGDLRTDADAELRMARALNEWARQTRLALTSVKPDRTASAKGMKEITFVVAGRGPLNAVASFLHRVETAEMPLKIIEMQLGSTGESGDNISLQLRLSTVYLGAGQKPAERPLQRKQEANDEDLLL
jgi:hypothetical protein